MKRSLGLILVGMLTVFLCDAQELPDDDFHKTDGRASYYAKNFQGRKTANGEKYNKKELTAAHLTLPFNTRIKVTCLDTKKSVVVRINDRGPHIKGRALDMSRAAAEKIGLTKRGKAKVKIEILDKKQLKPRWAIINR